MEDIKKNNFMISADKTKLDINLIHNFITHSYWAEGRTKETVKKTINNSLCFGVYYKDQQVGFARVTSDFTTFAHIADVFILQEYRGKGLSKLLMQYILSYPELKDIGRWLLATKDAHGLYAKFGFKPLENPEKYMMLSLN